MPGVDEIIFKVQLISLHSYNGTFVILTAFTLQLLFEAIMLISWLNIPVFWLRLFSHFDLLPPLLHIGTIDFQCSITSHFFNSQSRGIAILYLELLCLLKLSVLIRLLIIMITSMIKSCGQRCQRSEQKTWITNEEMCLAFNL